MCSELKLPKHQVNLIVFFFGDVQHVIVWTVFRQFIRVLLYKITSTYFVLHCLIIRTGTDYGLWQYRVLNINKLFESEIIWVEN